MKCVAPLFTVISFDTIVIEYEEIEQKQQQTLMQHTNVSVPKSPCDGPYVLRRPPNLLSRLLLGVFFEFNGTRFFHGFASHSLT